MGTLPREAAVLTRPLTGRRRTPGFVARIRNAGLSENNVLLLLAVVVGLLAGGATVLLESALRWSEGLFLGHDEHSIDAVRILLAPAAGAFLAGLVIRRGTEEARGHGVGEVIEATALRNGRISTRVAPTKLAASALTIGSGGSGGPEGPIVQIAASLASGVGRFFRMSEPRLRLLVACGAAGGIAASFNAPLAGVFFALEVVLQRVTSSGFATVVVSAVTASVMWRTAFGNAPVFDVPQVGLRHPSELLAYLVLGVAVALVAVLFVRLLHGFEHGFARLPVVLRPAVGGFGVGLVGLAVAQMAGQAWVLGEGRTGMNLVLAGNVGFAFLATLLVGKILTTSLTLGSGGSGGTFAPTLFIGAMAGTILGSLMQLIAPNTTASPTAYALVGMAACFSAAAQAPIASVLIVFEMTNDYRIMLPLMLACAVSTPVYAAINGESMYLAGLRRRGVKLSEGRERHLLERTPVGDALSDDFTALQLPAKLADVSRIMGSDALEWLVCVDDTGRYAGMLTVEGVREAMERDPLPPVESVIDTEVIPVLVNESLDEAQRKMAPRGLRVVPVIDSLATRNVVGVVSRETMNQAYWRALGRESDLG